MPDEQSPAAVVEAPQTVETPPSTEEVKGATATETAALEATKPDISSLLTDAETRKLFFSHPDVQKELDHRAASEAGRRTKAQMEAWQKEQEAASRARRNQDLEREMEEFIRDNPEHPLALKYRPVLDESKRERSQELLARAQEEAHVQSLGILGRQTFEWVQGREDLDDNAKAALQPQKFASWPEYLEAVRKESAKVEAKKLAADLLKTEREAIRQELLGELQNGERGPVHLPQGQGGARHYTAAEIAAMPLAEYRQNATDIDLAAKEGRIRG